METIKIAFVLDHKSSLSNEEYDAIIKNIRYSLYELRDLSFKKGYNFSLGFLELSEQSADNTKSEAVKIFALDTFSINQNNQNQLFEKKSESALNGFDRIIKYSQNAFAPEEVIQAVSNPAAYSKKFNTKTPKESSKKTHLAPVIFAVLFICLLLSSIPLIIYTIKQNTVIYKKVYTGDGDRLILRVTPDKSAKELLRLNEGEVVKLIESGPVWDNVEYHGFIGYVSNQYVIPAQKTEYEITNTDSKYNFGMACMYFDDLPEEGLPWIEAAAKEGLLQAQWEMRKINRDEELLNRMWLEEIADNTSPFEDILIRDWTRQKQAAELRGDTDIADNFTAKINEREQYKKEIYFAAFQKLCWEYVNENPSKSVEYYLKTSEWGTFNDSDYLETLASNFTGDEKIKWLKEAYKLGSVNSAWELANIYSESEPSTAVSYYEYCYKNYYNRLDSAYYICEYYAEKEDFKKTFNWLEKSYNAASYGTEDYYYLAYCLGLYYENGVGCTQSNQKALQYYAIAKDHVSEALEAYNKLNKKDYYHSYDYYYDNDDYYYYY